MHMFLVSMDALLPGQAWSIGSLPESFLGAKLSLGDPVVLFGCGDLRFR